MRNVNDHLFEVRYKPNPIVLDYRGAWTKAISDLLELKEWRITENRVDVSDKSIRHHAFVSFNNAGFMTRNSPTRNYFPDNSKKFMKLLFQLEGFEDKPHVERIGVRSRFCNQFDGPFDELVSLYSTHIISLNEHLRKDLGIELLDIGSPLTMKDKLGNINFMGGPMVSEQTAQFFKTPIDEVSGLPKVGLVFDIDYWITPNKSLTEDELVTQISLFADESWKHNETLRKRVTGG